MANTTQRAPKILVSGAGIAGGVFPFWLLRAYPEAQITIVERSATPRLTGASIDIRNSAVDIIKLMGLESAIREHGTNEEGVSIVNSNGGITATIGKTGRTDVQSFTSEYEIFRGALTGVFLGEIKDRVEIIGGDYVKSFTQDQDGVQVEFANGKEAGRWDLLVAADGLGSRIRGQLLGTDSKEQCYDTGMHVAYFTIKKDLLEGSKIAKWYNATGRRVILLRPDPRGYTRGHFMNVTLDTEVEKKKKLNDAIEKGNNAYKALIEESFHDAGWISDQVIKGMHESDDFYCSLFGQTRCPSIQKGRVVLLGDAGYACPGIGTSLAIMGAYILAGELLREPNNFPLALQRYEDRILPFAKSQQGSGKDMQMLTPETSWGISIRNWIATLAIGLKLDVIGTTVAAKLGLTEKMLELPDYEWDTGKKDGIASL